MGINSRGLFASPESARIDVATMPRHIIQNINSYLSFDVFEGKETITLKDFMDSFGEYVKHYGYMTLEFWNIWEGFLLSVARMNPDITRIDLHFYCMDEQIPYIISVQGEKCWFTTFEHDVTQEMWLDYPKSKSVSDGESGENDESAEESENDVMYEDDRPEFNVERYRANYKDVCGKVVPVSEMKDQAWKLDTAMTELMLFGRGRLI